MTEHITVPPNWFADGQHILVLVGTAVGVACQVAQFWRQNITNKNVRQLQNFVQANDKEILGEISAAQQSLNKVVESIAGRTDRRKPSTNTPMPGGRRATDPPATAPRVDQWAPRDGASWPISD